MVNTGERKAVKMSTPDGKCENNLRLENACEESKSNNEKKWWKQVMIKH